jgi:two-component system cell cycle sensor histidine kinase/response regulator CckA
MTEDRVIAIAEGIDSNPDLKGREVILVAEDEDPVRNFATRVLTRAGYRVIQATDGHDALITVEREPTRIDLVLTDVVMPGMSGPELHRRLSSIHPGLKVLFMSGYPGEMPGAAKGRMPEDIAFLQKPFEDRDLLVQVRNLLDARGGVTHVA